MFCDIDTLLCDVCICWIYWYITITTLYNTIQKKQNNISSYVYCIYIYNTLHMYIYYPPQKKITQLQLITVDWIWDLDYHFLSFLWVTNMYSMYNSVYMLHIYIYICKYIYIQLYIYIYLHPHEVSGVLTLNHWLYLYIIILYITIITQSVAIPITPPLYPHYIPIQPMISLISHYTSYLVGCVPIFC